MIKRQLFILKTLYNTGDFVTFSDLSDILNVSVKTIRNDISELKKIPKNQNSELIETKPHLGVRFTGNEDEYKQIAELLKNDNNAEDTEVFVYIINQLLKNGNLTAQKLAQQYHLSRPSLDKILDAIAQWFSKNHIICDRIRGRGISIKYSEFNYRLAMLDFYKEYKNVIAKNSAMRDSRYFFLDAESYTSICSLLDGFDADKIAGMICNIEDEHELHFSYSSHISLIFLISLSIIRARKGININVPKPIDCLTDSESDIEFVNRITKEIENEFKFNLSSEEKKFLTFLFSTAEIQNFDNDSARRNLERKNVSLCIISVKFVNLVCDIIGMDLRDDKFFITQIFLQLKAAINRLKYGIDYKNQLLVQIKDKYSNMLAAAWSAGALFEKELGIDLNEHEAGFLALHIGGAVERRLSSLNVGIVCDYGIGISQILKEKIERSIPELIINDVLSNRDFRKIRTSNFDFVISTIPLDKNKINCDVVTVGHLLSSVDIKKINEQMKKTKSGKRDKRKKIRSESPERDLFNSELIFTRIKEDNKVKILKSMCSRLENLGFVSKGFEKSVLEREMNTSTEIGHGIALPHGHCKYVNRSVAAFAMLDKPILWFDGDDYVDMIFLLAFDLDESKETKNQIIKFYKSIVGFMDDEKSTAHMRTLNSEDEIKDFLENL